MNKLLYLLFIAFISSCNFFSKKEILTPSECDSLSLNCFVGKPNDCYELKKSCSSTNYKYTKEVCQDAFNKLMFGVKKEQLKTNYGDRILECFTEDQVKKYLN